MPTLVDVMAELESYGSPNIRKILVRHGLGENLFGVKYGDLKPMAKRLKAEHTLALELWETGNHEARILAGMIADPKRATLEMLSAWGRSVTNQGQADELSKFTGKTAFAREMAAEWQQDADEWISMTGWNLIGQIALNDPSQPDSYFEPYIAQITREIHTRPNFTRYAMNGALIAIGTRNANLEAQALEAAEIIGVVDVDHGQTACETPDATSYIRKTIARKGHLLKI